MKRNLKEELIKHITRQVTLTRDVNNAKVHTSRIDTFNERHPPQKNLYYHKYRPILLTLQVLGRFAFRFSAQDDVSWRYFSWQMLYAVICYSIQTYLALLICFNRAKSLLKAHENYDEFIFAIHLYAYISIHFHVPFTFWRQGPDCAKYINLWKKFQEEWFDTFGDELGFRFKRGPILVVCFVLPAIMTFLVLENYSTLSDPWHHILPYWCCLVSACVILGLWYLTCLDVGYTAKRMATRLVKKLDKENSVNVEFLRNWRRLWILLCLLTSSIGTHLSSIILSILFTYSNTFLLGLYNSLSTFLGGHANAEAFGYLVASSMSLSFIYILCDGGHRATSKVGTYASQHFLRANLDTKDDQVKYEIGLVLRTLACDPPEIRLGGYMTMDRALILSIIGTVITYLIVILQFKI